MRTLDEMVAESATPAPAPTPITDPRRLLPPVREVPMVEYGGMFIPLPAGMTEDQYKWIMERPLYD